LLIFWTFSLFFEHMAGDCGFHSRGAASPGPEVAELGLGVLGELKLLQPRLKKNVELTRKFIFMLNAVPTNPLQVISSMAS
jgi:hypothetical protein